MGTHFRTVRLYACVALVLSTIGVTTALTNDASAVTGPIVVAGLNGPATKIADLLPGDVGPMVVDSTGRLVYSSGSQIVRVEANGALTIIAGNGTSGSDGDGGLATAAHIGAPNSLTYDSNGNLYFFDGSFYVIRKINAMGVISTVAGISGQMSTLPAEGDGGQAIDAKLESFIFGLAVTGDGAIFIAEGGGRIRRIAPNGGLSTFAGAAPGPCSGFPGPVAGVAYAGLRSIALDGAGNLLVALDCGNPLLGDRVATITPDGTSASIVAGGGITPVAAGVALSTAILGSYIRAQWIDGSLTLTLAQGTYKGVSGNIAVVNETGPLNCTFATGDALSAICLSALADDPTGGAFVNSMLGVGHVSAGGVLTRLTASPTSPDDGQKATQVPLAKSVSAITSDAAGQLYFITATGAKVRRIATNGIVGTAAGTGILDINNRFTGSGGAAISATLPWMTGLAVGSDGSILVASGTQVASVRPDHKLALIAGNGVYLNSGDNGAAKTASVLPSAVAESGGSVYIAGVTTKMCGAVPFTYVCPDKGNLRRVSPNGVITTVYVSPNLVWSDMTALPDGTIALISDDGKALVFVNPVTKVATVVATPTAYNLGSPHLYADSAGTLFVSANLAAVKRTASGAWSAIAGGASGGITGDDAGTVYLNEYSTIVKYLGLAAKKADPAQVSAGASHSCIRLSNSTVKCWGANGSGQLGNGSVVGSRVPLTVPGLSSVGQVSAGAAFTCAVVTPGASGTVKCWGANSSGQLGSGSTSASTVPVVVQTTGGLALKGVSSVATGDAFACAVSSPGSNGTVRCWGKNASGQLGDNTTTNRTRAVQVRASATVALKGVTSVAAGGSTACATLTTGSVRCWGANNHGQLGRGNTVASKLAVQVSGIDGIAAKASKLEIGDSHTCAVLTTRAVRCWGLNTSGQLGDGTTTQRLTPVAVTTSPTATLSGVTAITAGGNHTCAILGAGVAARVRCWGSDASGQLGNTRTGNKTRAVAVAGTLANGTSAISAGVAHTVAVVPGTPATTKDVAAWGSNSSGQLGDGTATGRATPMRCPYL